MRCQGSHLAVEMSDPSATIELSKAWMSEELTMGPLTEIARWCVSLSANRRELRRLPDGWQTTAT
jgi:hypothetical protein